MEKVIVDGVDIFNPIDGKLDYFIDLFTKVYGEKYKEQIETKLKSATYIFMLDSLPDEMIEILGKISQQEINDKVTHYLKQKQLTRAMCVIGYDYSCENIFECLKDKPTLKAFKWLLFKGGFIKNITTQNVIKFFKDSQHKEMFLDYLASINREVDEIKNNVINKYKGGFEYFKKITEKVNKQVENCKEVENRFLTLELQEICAKNGKFPSEQECQEMLQNFGSFLELGKNNFVQKVTLINKEYKKKFTDLLTFMGYNTNLSLKYYAGDAHFLETVFSKEDFYLHMKNEFRKKISNANLHYCEQFEKIKNLNIKYISHLEDFNDSLTNFCFNTSNCSGYVQNCETKDGRKSFCVCRNALALDDRTLLHEMGHLIDGEYYGEDYYKDGLNFCDVNLDNSWHSHFGMLNEAFNEYMTLKVLREHNKNGIKIGLCEGKSCTYMPAVKLLKEFFEKYEDKLIECKLSNEPYKLINYFGKKNLDSLEFMAGSVIRRYGEKNPQKYDSTMSQCKVGLKSVCQDIKKHIMQEQEKN